MTAKELDLNHKYNNNWWKDSVIYQIYPRSFMDSNDDGIGDLPGITSRLEYLQHLGVDIVWISPCFASPNADHGYDISDYCAIMQEFGTMEDFDTLLAKAHELGLKIVLDLVVNHSSDEHPWFVESRKSKDNPYRDYYMWHPGKPDGKGGKLPPNNWGSNFTPSAWEYDEHTEEYYLHLFTVKQPDLNWDNEKLRKEVYSAMRFWLDKGIDGFRMDVLNCYKKPDGLPDSTKPATCADGYTLDNELYANNPGMIEILQEMRDEVRNEYDIVTIGETSIINPTLALDYVNDKTGPLDLIFHFDVVADKLNFTWKYFKDVQRRWNDGLMQNGGWNSQYLQNHDQPRMVSVYGDDSTEQNRVLSSKMLATVIHTMPGTPFVYQGEELGMTNHIYTNPDDMCDPKSTFVYNEMMTEGKTHEEAMAFLNRGSRAHSRTPMQWDDSVNAGFSTGKTWQPVNPNYKTINAATQQSDDDSVFNFYRKLISLRKSNPAMARGNFIEYCKQNDNVFVYTRSYEGNTLLVAVNFIGENQKVDYDFSGIKQLALSNYKDAPSSTLRPFEAAIMVL